MKFASKITLALAAVASVAGFATAASAHTDHWARHHSHRHEVLLRDHHRVARIRHERRDEALAHRDARALRASDHPVARQDHADARVHGEPAQR